MAANKTSNFSSVFVDASEPGTPQRRSQTNGGAGRSGPVAEALASSMRSSPRKGGVKPRTVFMVVASALFILAAVCAAGYFVFLRPEEDQDAETVPTDNQGSAVRDVGAAEQGSSVSDDTAATTDGTTVLSPTDDSSDSDVGVAVTDSEVAAAPGSQEPMLAPAPGLAPVAAPAPVLSPVAVNPALGSYDPPMPLPVIPVAAAVLPSGQVIMWSAETPDDFSRVDRYVVGGGGSGKTQHAVWNPISDHVSSVVVSSTGHDMFCPGVTMMPNGDIIVTGGQNADKTSIYHLADGTWNVAPEMHISRGYGSSCLLSNGKVFVLGGSWSGPKDLKKDAEIYDATAGTWTLLPGIQAALILTDDPEDKEKGTYRADNYGWFFSWSNGTVFHAGPSTSMHWFDTAGQGSVLTAGTRPGGNSANGNAVMYDTGKILTCGGSEAFAMPEYPATTDASIITITAANTLPQIKPLAPMKLARVYANGCALPDGKVFITGGADTPKEFSDAFAHDQPEIWDPETETFTLLNAKHQIPRTYHSVAVLLPDARVFTGGGGLCGKCSVNHLDAEIFNPPYLFNADGTAAPRPNITLSAQTVANGGTVTITASEQLMMVSMVRMGGATHSTNTDQRRLELCGPYTAPCSASPIAVTVSADPGIALPGNWMIFGVNAMGTPSVAEILLVGV